LRLCSRYWDCPAHSRGPRPGSRRSVQQSASRPPEPTTSSSRLCAFRKASRPLRRPPRGLRHPVGYRPGLGRVAVAGSGEVVGYGTLGGLRAPTHTRRGGCDRSRPKQPIIAGAGGARRASDG
jgi:hypothetical protein